MRWWNKLVVRILMLVTDSKSWGALCRQRSLAMRRVLAATNVSWMRG